MYIQITTRCNMSCAHCCYACGPKGEDMPLKTYEKALELAEYHCEHICIGGGEPTLHKDFWTILGLSLGSSCNNLWMATNGSITKTALKLANLARKGVMGVALSQDPWHDPIHHDVVEAFGGFGDNERRRRYWPTMTGSYINTDLREIRDVSQGRTGPSPVGRAAENQLGSEFHCVCDDMIVTPDGKLWSCGCKSVQWGTVWKPEIPEDRSELWDGMYCVNEYLNNQEEAA